MHENDKYDLVVTDFPWQYENKQNGNADAKYATLSLEELAALMRLHGEQTFARDAVLGMWVTVPFKWAALPLMEAAGFDYKTTLFWHKAPEDGYGQGRLGTGYWFRNEMEELWVGSRGKAKAFRSPERNVVRCPATKHSSKPERFQDLLEEAGRAVGLLGRLELFARRHREGWRCEGLELTGHDHRLPLPMKI